MGAGLKDKLVLAISSRALFDLEKENKIFKEKGLNAYVDYMKAHEDVPMKKGVCFDLAKAWMEINEKAGKDIVDLVIVSKNSGRTGRRLHKSLDHYGLKNSRSALLDGGDISVPLQGFHVDLFLSKNMVDVQKAVDLGFAAAHMYETPEAYAPKNGLVHFAFDGDAVIFGPESEQVYKESGLDAFRQHEIDNRYTPMKDGPFANFLRKLGSVQKEFRDQDVECPIRTALVTARGEEARLRVLNTLESWDLDMNEQFFMSGEPKTEILRALNPNLFFDDQDKHCAPAADYIPAALVPYETSKMTDALKQNITPKAASKPQGQKKKRTAGYLRKARP